MSTRVDSGHVIGEQADQGKKFLLDRVVLRAQLLYVEVEFLDNSALTIEEETESTAGLVDREAMTIVLVLMRIDIALEHVSTTLHVVELDT